MCLDREKTEILESKFRKTRGCHNFFFFKKQCQNNSFTLENYRKTCRVHRLPSRQKKVKKVFPKITP